jgi:TldD protein
MTRTVDADFLALPLTLVSDAAILTATSAGASHVDVRIERTRTGFLSLRDAKPETQSDETNFGIGIRVIVNGAWGFASSPDVSADSAKKLALTAVAMAKTSKQVREQSDFVCDNY